MKKNPGELIILHMCIINYDQFLKYGPKKYLVRMSFVL